MYTQTDTYNTNDRINGIYHSRRTVTVQHTNLVRFGCLVMGLAHSASFPPFNLIVDFVNPVLQTILVYTK